ncbi:MAG: uroporphyrinogen-III C-methyltransferase [Nitrospirae bacterium]|nr:MAG: uroporphyrinogen-III C-methyltransferase [Nitrospirota bacterium]
MQPGTVYLVGAGPGDPGLLTLRGKTCLEQADVVCHDNLANPLLLTYAPPEAERIYVGRRGRGAYMPQEAINQLLVDKAREGKRVVRLKGGDPLVFGRGGEEAEWLAASGVPFEIVPGVTSAIAVPAYAGIPVTHRTLASVVTIVTGHEDPHKEQSALEWPRLASADGTLVFVMGMKNLPTIVQRLLDEGKAPDTPVALIRWGTYAHQRTVIGTLADIVSHAQAEQMTPPTVIVIGQVVRLREQLNWFETRPLFGKRILVTRAQDQAEALTDLIAAYGGEAVECPMIEIRLPDDWHEIDQAIDELSSYHWLIFTSANGVKSFLGRMWARGFDTRHLHGIRVGCIGPRTAEEVEKYGVKADLIPQDYVAEGLIEAMRAAGVAGRRVLIARAAQAREILPEQLKAMGAFVRVLPAYVTVAPPHMRERVRALLRERNIAAVTFTSSSTVRNFCAVFPDSRELQQLLQGVVIACIGPITAQTAREAGLPVHVVAPQHTVPDLVRALALHMRERV